MAIEGMLWSGCSSLLLASAYMWLQNHFTMQ